MLTVNRTLQNIHQHLNTAQPVN